MWFIGKVNPETRRRVEKGDGEGRTAETPCATELVTTRGKADLSLARALVKNHVECTPELSYRRVGDGSIDAPTAILRWLKVALSGNGSWHLGLLMQKYACLHFMPSPHCVCQSTLQLVATQNRLPYMPKDHVCLVFPRPDL